MAEAPAPVPAPGTEGTLITFSVIRKPPAPFADEDLYAVAVVDLLDGRRVTGRLADFDPEPALGATVTVTGSTGKVPVFSVN